MKEEKIQISSRLSLEFTEHDSCMVVSIAGDLAPDNAMFFETLKNAAEKYRYLVLDMSQVKYMNSACIGMLIRLLKHARKNNGNMLMCCLNPYLSKICKIVALDKVFQIFDTREKALEELGNTDSA